MPIFQSHPRQVFGITADMIVLAAILYCSWPLGFWLNPVAQRRGLASELGAAHQPYNWLFIGADIVSGVLLLIACIALIRLLHAKGLRKASLILLAVYGVCGAIDASLPLSCLPSVQACGSIWRDPIVILHGIADFGGSAALIGTLITEFLYARRTQRSWLPWIYVIGGGGVVFAGLSLLFIITNGPGFWAQRYYLTLSSIWVASLPAVLHSQLRTVTSQTMKDHQAPEAKNHL